MRSALAALAFALATVASSHSLAGGRSVFVDKCVICHQAAAQGVPGTYPPLANTIGDYVRIPAGRKYLAHVVIFGMEGEMVSGGMTYEGLMPPNGELSDAEIAATLNQVLQSFNARRIPAGFTPFTDDEIRAARSAGLKASQMPRERRALLDALKARAGGDHTGSDTVNR